MRERHLWIIFILSAVFLFFFNGAHILLMHIKPLKKFAHHNHGPFLLLLNLFMLSALYHGLYGVRGIFVEKLGRRKFVDGAFIVFGVVLAVFLIIVRNKLV